jgi:type I restriction-modification system DNA methylase subunit
MANKKKILSQAPVTHACYPSYSGGRNQEDHNSRPAQANSSLDLISKIPYTKKGWWSDSSNTSKREALSSNPEPPPPKKSCILLHRYYPKKPRALLAQDTHSKVNV